MFSKKQKRDCRKKKKYSTLGSALMGGKKARDNNGSQLAPYRCGLCPKFHLTSKKRKW